MKCICHLALISEKSKGLGMVKTSSWSHDNVTELHYKSLAKMNMIGASIKLLNLKLLCTWLDAIPKIDIILGY